MEINLPSDAEIIVFQKAEAAGFGEDVSAYVVHLISADKPSEAFTPLVGNELDTSLEMIRRGEEDLALGKTQDMREALEEIAVNNGLKITK